MIYSGVLVMHMLRESGLRIGACGFSTRHLQIPGRETLVPIPCRLDKFLHDGCKLAYEEVVHAWTSGRVEYQPGALSNKPFAKDHIGNTGKFMSDIYVFEDDEVKLDGQVIQFRDPSEPVRCFALNKPPGISMEKAFDTKEIRRRQHERIRVQELQKMGRKDISIGPNRIYSFIDKLPPGFFPVGRLDKDTTGLLLLTNCGDFANFLTTPGKYIKEYQCEITRPFLSVRDQPRIDHLLKGIFLREKGEKKSQIGVDAESERGPARASYVNVSGHALAEPGTDVGKTWTLTIGISEGRNRVVRRMLGAVKLPLGNLHRLKVGSVDLNQLGLLIPGALHEISSETIEGLWNSMQPGASNQESPKQQVVTAKLNALKKHAEYLRSSKVNHPNSRLEGWLVENLLATPLRRSI